MSVNPGRMAKYHVVDEKIAVNHSTALGVLIVVRCFAAAARADSEPLLAAGGATQLEDSSGRGLNAGR
jgi:hypothetical protein